MKDVIKKYLSDLYNKNDSVYECSYPGDDWGEISYLTHFRLEDTIVLNTDYESFCNISSDTVLVERGNSEITDKTVYVVTGNHKGHRNITVLLDK